jgi:hypothetical protein
MRRERPGVDPPVAEELPERETTRGAERSAEGTVEEDTGGVEREAPTEAGDDAGVESPPREADRADLLP